MKARIIGVQAIMKSFKPYFGCQLDERLLGQTDNLSRTLQNRDLSAMDTISLAEVFIKTLEKERSENQFELFWRKKINEMKKKLCIDDPIVERKKKSPKRLENFHGYSASKEHHPKNVEDSFVMAKTLNKR